MISLRVLISALSLTVMVIGGVMYGLLVGWIGLPSPVPTECEVVERRVMLHEVDLIVIPGGGDPIPMTGALGVYDRIDCGGGREFLLRSPGY